MSGSGEIMTAAELKQELAELKAREMELRSRLTLLAESSPGEAERSGLTRETPVMHADREWLTAGRWVKVTADVTKRVGQAGRIVEVVQGQMLPVKVKFADGMVIGYLPSEVEEYDRGAGMSRNELAAREEQLHPFLRRVREIRGLTGMSLPEAWRAALDEAHQAARGLAGAQADVIALTERVLVQRTKAGPGA